MSFKLIFAAEVYGDLQQNINWYNKKQAGLGSRFFKAIKEQLPQIKKNPYGVAIRYDEVRCAKVKDFPYMVHFKIFPEINIVLYSPRTVTLIFGKNVTPSK